MRSLLFGATGVVTLSVLGMGACGGSDLASSADAGSDARKLYETGVPDTYVPYKPLTTRCVAGPYPGGGIVTPDAAVDFDAGDDAGDAQPSLGPPQLVSFGGKTLHTPHVIPITYAGDDLADQIEDFVGSFGCTDYWRTVVSEYGVGQADMPATVRLTDPSPATISDPQIGAYVQKQVKAGAPGFANPPDDVIFAFYFGSDTLIELYGEQSCSSFGGYHSSTVVNGKPIAYAVMARCEDDNIDEVTGTSSHEFVEASTDPYPLSKAAYQQPDDNHVVYGFPAGGEAGDLCTFLPDAMFLPDGYPFIVQRTWSNASILSGGDPCVPAVDGAYIAGIPDQPDLIPVQNIVSGAPATRGVAIAVGDTRTIDVHLFAQDGSTTPWTIDATDISQYTEGQVRLNLSLDTTNATNGGVAHLTITRLSKGQVYGAEGFAIHSSDATHNRYWEGVVGDPM